MPTAAEPLLPAEPSRPREPLLQVRDLRTWFLTDSGPVRAVDGVSFDVHAGETLGIVGESGSGKSVTALSVLRLIPDPPGRIVAGEILFNGRDLLKLPLDEVRGIRGRDISMVFQEPMTSLNPVFTIGMQVTEVILAHQAISRDEAERRAIADAEEADLASATATAEAGAPEAAEGSAE